MFRSLRLPNSGKERITYYRGLVEAALREDISADELNTQLNWIYLRFREELLNGGFLDNGRIRALRDSDSPMTAWEAMVQAWAEAPTEEHTAQSTEPSDEDPPPDPTAPT